MPDMFKVGLGYCGPTDACLTLSFRGETKEYLIESDAWRILSRFWDIPSQSSEPVHQDTEDGKILLQVWNTRDEDCREEPMHGEPLVLPIDTDTPTGKFTEAISRYLAKQGVAPVLCLSCAIRIVAATVKMRDEGPDAAERELGVFDNG